VAGRGPLVQHPVTTQPLLTLSIGGARRVAPETIGVDVRVSLDGPLYEIDPALAGEEVVL